MCVCVCVKEGENKEVAKGEGGELIIRMKERQRKEGGRELMNKKEWKDEGKGSKGVEGRREG